MKPPRDRPANFQRNLARPITLRDGTQLKSLHDARTVLIATCNRVNAKFPALDRAIQLLLTAASTGTGADIKAATDQLEIVLRGRQLLQ